MNNLEHASAVNDEERFLLRQLASKDTRQAAVQRREQAMETLFRRYSGRFQSYYERAGLRAAEAEELVQEVFIRILNKAASYRGEAAPSAWLWTVARNAFISHRRRVEPPTHGDDESVLRELIDDSSAAALETEELVNCVRQQFQRYRQKHPERAEVLALVAFYGWQPKDLASYIGRTVAATREYLSQCRKVLKPYLHLCWSLVRDDA